MNNATPLLTFQIQGQTNGASVNVWTTGSAIGTLANISIYGDGSVVWTDAHSGKQFEYAGDNAFTNALLQALIVGAGGLPAGTKLFGFA